MSEAKRHQVLLGGISTKQMVLASDYDAAQSEIAALRAELGECKGEYDRAVNKVDALRTDLELTRLARQGDQIEIDGLKALCDGFRAQLADAAQSLETISLQAGRDEFMKDMVDVRGYANSRATVARGALSVGAKPNNSGDGEVKS